MQEKSVRKNHRYCELIINGVVVNVRTKISHSSKGSINPSLRNKIAKQLHMDGSNRFQDYFECSYICKAYIVDLKIKGTAS